MSGLELPLTKKWNYVISIWRFWSKINRYFSWIVYTKSISSMNRTFTIQLIVFIDFTLCRSATVFSIVFRILSNKNLNLDIFVYKFIVHFPICICFTLFFSCLIQIRFLTLYVPVVTLSTTILSAYLI